MTLALEGKTWGLLPNVIKQYSKDNFKRLGWLKVILEENEKIFQGHKSFSVLGMLATYFSRGSNVLESELNV